MVDQYPHNITVSWKSEATQDEVTGHYIAGVDGSFQSECRAFPNGKGEKTSGADGALIDYSYTVYMPKTSSIIPTGSDYVITGDDIGEIKGTIKRHHNRQLSSKLWV